MIKIAIVDDDIQYTKKIKDLILQSGSASYDIYTYNNVQSFVDAKIIDYEIIFFDIEIGSESGISTALAFRELNNASLIIFVTNYSQYISEAFKTMPFQYILKPIDEKLFYEEFNRAIKTVTNSKKSLCLKSSLGDTEIEIGTIKYIESINRRLLFHLCDRVVASYGILKDYANCLEPYSFIQCHASFVVNLKFVLSIKNYEITLKDGKKIPISKKHLESTREARGKYLLGTKL